MLQTLIYGSTVRPPVQTHVFFIIDSFVKFLLSDLSPTRELSIITNHYCTPIGKGPFILFNIEQLTRPKILNEVVERCHRGDIVEVWDYSLVNCRLLASKGIAARHVPVMTTEVEVQRLKSFKKGEPKFDIGFCGVCPPRRLKVLEELGKAGLKVAVLHSTYGPERDAVLANCRVHLNIHQTDDHKVFESVRCDPWLRTGMPIISETSLDDDPRCINVAYDKIVEKTLEIVEHLKQEATFSQNAVD